MARGTGRSAAPGEGGDAGARCDRGGTPAAADGPDARLHADRSRRTGSARRHLRRPIAAHRLQPHVERRRGMAVRRLHQLHVAVHPARLPRQLRRPVRDRHQRPIDEALAYRDKVGNQMDWYSSSESSFGADVDARPNGGSRSTSSCATATRSTAPGTPTVAVWSSSATPSPLKDILPWGRQEEWLDSPEGWPSRPTYSGWLGQSRCRAPVRKRRLTARHMRPKRARTKL